MKQTTWKVYVYVWLDDGKPATFSANVVAPDMPTAEVFATAHAATEGLKVRSVKVSYAYPQGVGA